MSEPETGTQSRSRTEPKTKPSTASVKVYLDSIPDPRRRADCAAVAALMQSITGKPPQLWGTNIVGFDRYRYVYASGRSGEWPIVGFSSRAQALTLYVMSGFQGESELMARLGRYKTGKSCLYIKTLADIDADVLEQLLTRSVAWMREKYPEA